MAASKVKCASLLRASLDTWHGGVAADAVPHVPPERVEGRAGVPAVVPGLLPGLLPVQQLRRHRAQLRPSLALAPSEVDPPSFRSFDNTFKTRSRLSTAEYG